MERSIVRVLAGVLVVLCSLMLQGPMAVAQSSADTEPAGCGGALGIGSEGDACISVVHASPDAPNVDIYVDGEHVLGNLAFGWWSNWLAVPAGDHRIQVTAAGAALDTAVIDATITVDSGMAYQVAATGFLAEIAPQVYPVDVSLPEEGNARVQVLHAVPDAPAVDVAVTGGDVLIGGLEFPDSSNNLDVPAGAYDLEVRVAETEDVVLPLPGVELESGYLYQVYAIGSVETGLYPFVIPTLLGSSAPPAAEGEADAGAVGCAVTLGIGAEADSCVNVVHASPDAPAVDVYVDGALALEGLAFGDYSGWVALPAGDHQVQVAATGEPANTAVIDATVTLEAGMAYQVAATGTLAEIAPQVYPVDLSDPGAEMARVRVIHASPDAPAVDVAVTGGDVLVADLAFPDASDALVVPAGAYDLEVRPAGTEDVALPLPGVTLEAGMVYDVFAIGLLEDGSLAVLVVPSTAAVVD
jgi:hypothetical protein